VSVIYYEEPQGSEAWMRERARLVTASVFKDAIAKPGTSRRTTLCRRLRAVRNGFPVDDGFLGPTTGGSVATAAMQRGVENEDAIRAMFELTHGVEVMEVGLALNSDYPDLGASLDGLIVDRNEAVEIKSPEPSILFEYHEQGRVPPQYHWQVHGQMLVCELDAVWFTAWHPRCSPEQLFSLRVERDEAVLAELKQRLDQFLLEVNK